MRASLWLAAVARLACVDCAIVWAPIVAMGAFFALLSFPILLWLCAQRRNPWPTGLDSGRRRGCLEGRQAGSGGFRHVRGWRCLSVAVKPFEQLVEVVDALHAVKALPGIVAALLHVMKPLLDQGGDDSVG